MTTLIIVLVVVFLALAMYADAQRRRSADQSTSNSATTSEDHSPLMADEALTTQTGRFRVREMLKKTEDNEDKDNIDKHVTEHSEDEEPLPDPFESPSR